VEGVIKIDHAACHIIMSSNTVPDFCIVMLIIRKPMSGEGFLLIQIKSNQTKFICKHKILKKSSWINIRLTQRNQRLQTMSRTQNWFIISSSKAVLSRLSRAIAISGFESKVP